MPRLIAPVLPAGSLSDAEQPVLRAGDLLLRPWAEADADALVTAFADPAIQRWHARVLESRQEAVELVTSYHRGWREETSAHWAITGPGVLGRVALGGIDLAEGSAGIAYWITPAARGAGTAGLATVAMSEWALGDRASGGLGLHRLELHHAVANTASCRVAEKAGYTYEGTRRRSCLHPDGWHDMHLHARVHGDP
jgi:RimJ/RimL family protein N-acetyltransferase